MSNPLYGAADILRTRGWTQGVVRNELTGGYCLLGALALAETDNENNAYSLSSRRSYKVLASTIEEVYGLSAHPGSNCVTFNDDVAEDREQVIEILEKAGAQYDEFTNR
jgi:hypothetical protein